MCRESAGEYSIEFRQSNAEHQLVDWIHEAIDRVSGIVINPGRPHLHVDPHPGCAEDVPGPVFELHITNIHRREAIYHNSLVSKAATAVIAGLGPDGYPTAVAAMVRLLGPLNRRAAPTKRGAVRPRARR